MKINIIASLFLIAPTLLYSFNDQDSVRYHLKEITVSATRTTERILETPLAITVIQKEQMMNNRGVSFDEAFSLVPGVLTQSRTGNQDVRIMIRGFGARGAGERSNAGTSRGLRFYTDGIPETEPDGRTSFDLLDLSNAQTIEVLRSNASALWGSASGGIVSVNTIPTTLGASINQQTTIGSFGFMKNAIRYSSVTNGNKMYVSLSNTSSDGWREHSQSYLTQLNVGMLSTISDKTKLGVYLLGATNNFRIPGPLSQSQFDVNPQQAQNDAAIYNPTYVQRDERRFNRLGRIGVTVDHQINDLHSVSAMTFVQPKYIQRSERNTFRDFTRYHVGGNFLYRNALEFSSSIKNQLVVGIDEQYQDGVILFYNLVNGTRGTTLKDNKREGANNSGLFVQDEIIVHEQISVLLGGRYDNITYYYNNFITPAINEERSFSQFTPKAGVVYRFTPSFALYANIGGGVEVPAGNETDPPSVFGEDTVRSINSLLSPVRSITYEVGAKQIVEFDNASVLQSLSYDVALYSVSVTNDIIPYRGGRFYFTAGKTSRTGIEAGAQIQFAHGVSLMGAVTYAKNIFYEYKVDSVYYSASKAGMFADYKNNSMPGVPNMFATLRARFVPQFFTHTFAECELRTTGKYFVDDANTLSVPAYTIADAVLGGDFSLLNDLTVRVFVRINNLFDTKYASSIWINPDRQSSLLDYSRAAFIEPGLPRNVIASISLNYAL